MRAKSVYNVVRDVRSWDVVGVVSIPSATFSHAMWLPNDKIVSGLSTGKVELHDFKQCIGKTLADAPSTPLKSVQVHTNEITHIDCNLSRTMLVTASIDKTCKVFDAESLESFISVNFEDQANSASIHPNSKYLIVTGGQPPMDVTQTSHSHGNFYTKFYYLPTGQLFGQCKSHFGTPLTCQFNPRGDGFASGGHDGFLKVHQLDSHFKSYERGLFQALSAHA